MKKIFFPVVAIVIFTAFSLTGIQAQTKQKIDKRNILDYYNLMSENILEHSKENSQITLLSKKSGYMEVKISDPAKWTFIALFRKDDGSPLLLVSHQDICSSSEGCFHYLEAYEIDEFDSFTSVEEQVFPSLSIRENLEIFNSKLPKGSRKASEVNLKYKLPLNGRIIKVIGIEFDEVDKGRVVELYELHLKNDKFVIVR